MQNGEIMRRELRTRQEANIRGVLALMQAQSSFRAEQLSAPLQPHLVPMPPLVRALAASVASALHCVRVRVLG